MTLIELRSLRLFDYTTLLMLGLLLTVGIMLVASASADDGPGMARRQAVWMVVGLIAASVLGILNYRHLSDNAYPLWGLAVALLAGVLLLGPEISGARSWFRIGGLSLQPSEFAKLATILALARLFADRQSRPFGLREMTMPTVLVAVPFVLVALQPDLGTAATFVPILAAMSWVAGLQAKSAGVLAGAGVVSAPIAYFLLEDYQRARLTSFLNPEADPLGDGYQLVQSKIAVGSGGITGKGLFSGTQSQLDFLPEQHNDFIMALMAEELGFVGVGLVLVLYLFLLVRLLRCASVARDRAGAYIAVGVAALLAFHLVVNVGMVIGMVPITGIPLPLLSSGGSSALSTCLAIGLVISVRTRRFLV